MAVDGIRDGIQFGSCAKHSPVHQHVYAPASRGLYYKLYQLQYKDQEIAVPGE
jgi:hypothetical protein